MNTLVQEIQEGHIKTLAHCISLIENQAPGYLELLKSLPVSRTPVIGITGPPGAGKSTLVNAITGELVRQKKKVGIVCIDPSSPFHKGALLGDRIRMNEWANHTGVYIRSLSSRGALGGLHPRIFEITDLLAAAPFDYILIETVGIGQSELEIARVANLTLVVLTPGSGDDIQAMKSGIMEIADLLVVNKADSPDTAGFIKNLKAGMHYGQRQMEILETIATENKGIELLMQTIEKQLSTVTSRAVHNQAEKTYRFILAEKMKEIDRADLSEKLTRYMEKEDYNLYRFAERFLAGDDSI